MLIAEWPGLPGQRGTHPRCPGNRTARSFGANRHQGHGPEVTAGSLSEPEPVS
jgi:hypothetical protein